MEIRNNNQAIEKKLAKVYYKKNWQRNRILVLAIAMSIFLLYAVFSIADGKLRSDYLIDVRGMGTVAAVSLENGSANQYKQMKELSYLADVGIKKTVMSGKYQNAWSGNVVYIDNIVYEKMLKPAVTDIYGSYPTKENEIMFPVRCFEQFGMGEPELGAQIVLELELSNGEIEPYCFVISGYYTDYVDAAINIPEVFVSKAFMEARQISMFPADKIMATQKSLEESESMVMQLYWDITMEYDSQQVFCENPMVMQSVEGVFGSISIMVGCGIIVILCAFMLIYNVVSISMTKDIQEYGLLKVLGTTNVQLKRIAYRQNTRNIVSGSIIGGMTSVVMVKVVLNSILQDLFMQGLGKSDVNGFYPEYLIFIILLISFVAFVATGLALRRVLKWNAIHSVKYVDTNVSYHRKIRKSTGSMSLSKLAWRNVTRSKKKLVISVISLLLAGTTAMGAAVIMRGTDTTNKIEKYPDFQFGILAGIFRYTDKVPTEFHDDTQILSPEVVNIIRNMDGIETETIEIVRGSYACINFEQNEALSPRKESIGKADLGVQFATIQIVDEDYVLELEEYAKKYNLDVDTESLKNGTGCILLHHNEMSQILNEKVKDILGKPIHFYSLDVYGDKANAVSYGKGSLECAGYMDMTAKYFPELQMTSIGNNINYFIMTKEAFQKLRFTEKVFDMSFDTKEDAQVDVNQKLSQIIQQENVKWREMGTDTFYLRTSYTILLAEQNRIHMSNTILSVLVIVIFVIGVMNFANTLATNHEVRKKEIAIMESIGLTSKQKKQMIFMEGIFYWLMILVGLLSLGSVVIWILGKAIAEKLLYFKFVYPWKLLFVLAVVLLVINMVLVWRMYSRDKYGSLRERLGKSEK